MQTTHKDLQDSGAYNTPFFTTKYISFDQINIDNIEWNRELHREYSIDEDFLMGMSEDEIYDYVTDDFYEAVGIYNYYHQVDGYHHDEEDAYMCNLIPFTYFDPNENEDIYLLALGGYSMDLIPKLDAYFFLQTGRIDPKSRYFSDKKYFKSIVPTAIFKAIEDKFRRIRV